MIRAAIVATLVVLLAAPAADGSPRARTDHVHASSRYDRSPASLASAAQRFARRADLVTWTEVSADRRARRLHRLSGWRSFTPDRSDLGISWRRDEWKPVRRTTRVLSRRHFTTAHGFRSPTQRAAVAVLDNRRTQARILVVVVHMPAGVEYGDGFRPYRPFRVATWTTALACLSRILPRVRDRWRPDAVILTGDWNVDVRRAAWRHTLRHAFPRLHLTWRRPLPARGTHRGGRLIDATLTDARGRARLLRHTAASDHTPYRERLRF